MCERHVLVEILNGFSRKNLLQIRFLFPFCNLRMWEIFVFDCWISINVNSILFFFWVVFVAFCIGKIWKLIPVQEGLFVPIVISKFFLAKKLNFAVFYLFLFFAFNFPEPFEDMLWIMCWSGCWIDKKIDLHFYFLGTLFKTKWHEGLEFYEMEGLSFYCKSFYFESILCSNISEFPLTLVSDKICQMKKANIEINSPT